MNEKKKLYDVELRLHDYSGNFVFVYHPLYLAALFVTRDPILIELNQQLLFEQMSRKSKCTQRIIIYNILVIIH